MAENNIIVYDFDELEKCLSQLEQAAEAIQNIKSISEQLKNGSADYWQGRAFNAFEKRFSDMNGAVDKLSNQIFSGKNKLAKAIEMSSRNEEAINSSVERLSADNIF